VPPKQTFGNFWRHYLGEHAHAATRALHYLGTTIGVVSVVIALITENPWLAAGGVVLAYILAWTGHYFIERNHPCTFVHPLWSLFGDMRMLFFWLTGRIDGELKKAGVPPE
jgi:hypothetical protein